MFVNFLKYFFIFFSLFAFCSYGSKHIESNTELNKYYEIILADAQASTNDEPKPLSSDSNVEKPIEASEEDASKKEAPKEQASENDTAKKDASENDTAKKDASENDTAKKDASEKEAPKEDAPKKDAPKKDAPKKDASKKDASENDTAKKEVVPPVSSDPSISIADYDQYSKFETESKKDPHFLLGMVFYHVKLNAKRNILDRNLSDFDKYTEIKNIMNDYFMPYVDEKYVSMFVLGKNNINHVISKYGKPLLNDYLKAYREYMLSFYAKLFINYNGKQDVMCPPIPSSKTDFDKIKRYQLSCDMFDSEGRGERILFKFRKKRDGVWGMYDVVIRGSTSVAIANRDMIAEEMSKNNKNINKVISILVEKTNSVANKLK